MQFRGRSTPPPYLNRRDQLRMLGLVLALGVVVFAIRVAGQPAFWARIFPDEPVADRTTNEDVEQPAVDRTTRPPLRPDNVTVVEGAVDASDSGSEPMPVVDRAEPLAVTAPRFAFTPHPPKKWFDPVQDNTLGVRSDEALGHYGSLAMARNADTIEEFEAASEERPSRTNLMHFPEQYRGRLVTIEGNLERLLPFDVGGSLPEIYGYDQLWEAWVATPDAPEHPIRCVLTSLPEPLADGRTIPTGERIGVRAKVSVTGFFFKVQAFDNGRGGTRTPLILGRQPHWFPPAPVVVDSRSLTPYVVAFASLVAVSLAAVLIWYQRSDRRFADAHVRHFTEAPEGAIESLAGIETVDPNDLLRQLAEAEEE